MTVKRQTKPIVQLSNKNLYKIFAIEDGDCIHINGAEYFHYSPGGYDPGSHVMSDVECRAKCGSFFLPYSGILKQKLCLCAKDDKALDFGSYQVHNPFTSGFRVANHEQSMSDKQE
ncbi:uncharacterized protein CEXT_424401 [Caerostris extrusa]|uniref:WSC domain-containing protein n=1 Tax=Caerostris extrusa TaxID=172846 RepID=A0AAV4P9Q5_CAEEX|nr:uncharacterized protein CEXT_424401 [Caerostris extrusa]